MKRPPLLSLLLVAVPIALALRWRDADPLWVFIASCVAIVPLYILVGRPAIAADRDTRRGTIYVAGKVKALGIDCVPGEWTDDDTEYIERKFRIYGLGTPPSFDKFVCGKKLYNYDNLEPSERKLVIH